eukprot:snap_masked-scaffold1179_size56971-processed-gene-0.8 protein:Tk06636 transcript:snap_masked-scaffold1179_size56971-processed-gene-0.8-mRNA-1 annotation:"hypothetical protein LOTGIDRAFT_156721"
MSISEQILGIEERLGRSLEQCPKDERVAYTYNPIAYALEPHQAFLETYLNTTKQVLFLGMNPGPWGMAQTGVPFGEISMVRDWLKISGRVDKPVPEHPQRPIEGFQSRRKEVSGQRFWTLIKELTNDNPAAFFRHCAVYNHCPVAYLASSGKNLTPVDMKVTHRQAITALCDQALIEVIQILEVRTIVAIGRYAQIRAQEVAQLMKEQEAAKALTVHYLNHPSPASAQANQGWHQSAREKLTSFGLMSLLKSA